MDAVDRHFAGHHGIITRAEARKCGLGDRTISRRVHQGRWERLYPGVFRLMGSPPTWASRARALALAYGGLISHRSAARIWRIEGYHNAPLHLTVPEACCPDREPDVLIHRSRQFRLASPTTRNAIPVTGLARTVLDLAAVESRTRLDLAVDAVLRQRLLGWHDLIGIRVRHSRQGRNGCGKLGALIEDRWDEQRPAGSVFNRMVGDLLADSGLGGFDHEHEIREGAELVARVDIAYPGPQVAVELDGRAYHDDPFSFVEDRRRANRIVNLGWHLLRFTWDDYADTPDRLVQTVQDAVHARRRTEPPHPPPPEI